jgi:4-nitrophenyl phosphatase
MIGDRLDTDIEFGLNGGIDTLCVLTGKLRKGEKGKGNAALTDFF